MGDSQRSVRGFFKGLRDLETRERLADHEAEVEAINRIFREMNQDGIKESIERARAEATRMIRKVNPNLL